jgi:lipopolysaccharide assembly outer membrane protein LptD (OstA)
VRLSFVNWALACSVALVVPQAGSSQDTIPSRLHATGGTDRAAISFAADSIVKEDGATGYGSVIHLKGNVEIRTCCVQLPAQNQVVPRNPAPPQAYIIMRADEADYNGDTGNIEARGIVRITSQVVDRVDPQSWRRR